MPPDVFLWVLHAGLGSRSSALAQKYTLWQISELPHIKAKLEEKGLTWADVGPSLEVVSPGRPSTPDMQV